MLLAAGCLSDPSAPDASEAAADSSATPTPTTVSQAPIPDPAALTKLEKRAEDRTVGEKLADASLETRVKRALVGTSTLRVFPFRPTVIDGHLILRGDVNTPDQYQIAERVAGRVEGIDVVTNRLSMGGRPVTEARLSEKQSADVEDSAVYHTVRSGDNLWDIARKYGASVQQIRNLNDLRSSNLRPGQRIRVR
jgi:osmotically-inducible protein OsmY